ncbi:unnamed protein product [Pleuronectes platessa]|uniref:Uncharacterized protein n=1 Tax=Pleuronectes platessa TaxID=8262 RepID=A0A9N7UA81_PLEPL|nr:unnamed protein product [Pleuronectes platessa]
MFLAHVVWTHESLNFGLNSVSKLPVVSEQPVETSSLLKRSTPLFHESSQRRMGVQLTLSSHITFMEERCSFQLISPRKPPRNPSSTNLQAATPCPAGELETAAEMHRPTEPPRQEPQNQQDHFTELQTAQQPLSLSMDG